MIKPAEEVTSQTSNRKYKTGFPLTFSLMLIALTLGFIILILSYYSHQKNAITDDIKSDLKVIADLKVKQISDWRNERVLDGYMIYDNKILIKSLLDISEGISNEFARTNMTNWFANLCSSHNYISVRLVSKDGEIYLSYPEEPIKIGEKGKYHILQSALMRKPYLSDFHFYENSERIHMDMVIPLLIDTLTEPNKFLVLEIDPYKNLYPAIQTWPADSKTAETLIIEKSGNDVLFLNDLRHKSGTALRLKVPSTNDTVPAVKAVKGYIGVFEGLDYRGVPVLSYLEPIPGTDWKIVAKKDKEEIYEDINISSLWVASLVVLVVLLAVIVIVMYWGRQKEKFLKRLIDGERKRVALTSHFENLIKNANDIFILYDENVDIIEVNEKALSVYGYTRDEFLKLGLNDLRAPEFRGDVSDTIKYVQNHPDGLIFETKHVKKDGTIFPIESSTRYIQLGDRFYFQSVVRDITDRKKAELDLKESEAKFSSIFLYSPVAVLIASKEEGKLLDVNHIFIRDIGFSREELIGKTTVELGFFSDINERTRFLQDVNEYGHVYGKEYKFRRKDGKILDCLVSTVKVSFSGSEYFVSSILDITDRKKAEERVKYFNRLYAFLSQVNQSIVRIDNRDELFKNICNIAIEFGKFSFAWIGLIDFENNKVTPTAYSGFENGYLKTIENSCGNNLKENPFVKKLISNGKNIISNNISEDDFYINDRTEAVRLGFKSSGIFPLRENNKIVGILCLYSDELNCFDDEEVRLFEEVTMDISFALDYYVKESQRKETNEALGKSEKKFRTLFDNAGDAILLLDDYRFIEFNIVAEKLYGLDRNSLLFKSPVELSPEFQSDGKFSIEKGIEYMDSAYSGNSVNFEWLHSKPDGSAFEVEVNLNSVYIGSKKMLLAVVRDISSRKKFEKDLKAAVERAEEMNRIKSNFLANMSHELRTPMTGILGFAEVLSKSLEDPEQKEMAEVIFKGGKCLTSTLNMILDLSKIEAEKVVVNLKNENLSTIVYDSVKLFEVTAAEKKLFLKAEINDEVSAEVDSRLLEQVLSNLIKNAVIYTEKGGLTVSLSKVSEGGIDYADIQITDTGIGIPENSLRLIFEPFRQVSEGWTRTFEGTGLGLTISKKFVELMGGEIDVFSKINEGTTFTIRFKASIPKTINAEPVQEVIFDESEIKISRKIKTLLVEDDEFTVYTIKHVLKDICDFELTNNGYEAVKLAEQHKYEIILMDIGLKGMDGLEATKKIRKIPGYEKIPIVALTAYAMEGDKERFFNAGCSHYISKPFSNYELRKFVSGLK